MANQIRSWIAVGSAVGLVFMSQPAHAEFCWDYADCKPALVSLDCIQNDGGDVCAWNTFGDGTQVCPSAGGTPQFCCEDDGDNGDCCTPLAAAPQADGTPGTTATSPRTNDFQAGPTTVRVRAKGDTAFGTGPHMVVQVGGTTVGAVYVQSSTWTDYDFSFSAPAGNQEVRIAFDNDVYLPPFFDRNLHVDKATVTCGEQQ